SLDDAAQIVWRGEPVARLVPGAERLKPQVQVLTDERIEAAARLKVEARLKDWLAAHMRAVLGPLVGARDAGMTGKLRGIVYHLSENLGAVRRGDVEEQLSALS